MPNRVTRGVRRVDRRISSRLQNYGWQREAGARLEQLRRLERHDRQALVYIAGRTGTPGSLRGWRDIPLPGGILASFGLLGMLTSYLTAFGFGIEAGLIAAGAAPLLVTGVVMDRSWTNVTMFLVGMTMGAGWVYAALTW